MQNEDIIDYYKPVEKYKYAGFWVRVGAYFLDFIILIVPVAVLQSLLFGSDSAVPKAYENLAGPILWWLYHATLESSSLQATFGKVMLELKVMDENGERLSFGRASGRHWAKIISTLLLFYGYIQIGFDKRNQGLHDKIAGCLVVYHSGDAAKKQATISEDGIKGFRNRFEKKSTPELEKIIAENTLVPEAVEAARQLVDERAVDSEN